MRNTEKKRYINPLFWQHGEDESILREEIREMKSRDINDFIMEARPHKDYLGEGWFRDIRIAVDEAEKLDMHVWIFDDGDYPSGKANGELARKYPEALKKYLCESHIDVIGPLPHAHFLVGDFVRPGEQLFRVIVGKRQNHDGKIVPGTLRDITELCEDGRLYYAVPEGDYRIFIIKISPYGKEVHTSEHLNPLSAEAVDRYIELVYEKHYRQLGEYFGGRISGFFTDEPRFGNTVGYDSKIGRCPDMPPPYTEGLLEELSKSPLGDFTAYLPCLWYDCGDISCDARYVYMDTVSRLFNKNYLGRVGDWCRKHGVKLIGHVVEENGAHSRLGYGAAHYFRAMEGLDASGIDIVNNLYFERTEGTYLTEFNNYDCDFNHFGLPKMASSAAHLDAKKNGVAVCEAYGAYGWAEGLKLMKWITDILMVRGVNYIIPHAFSPAPFPDPDCPPHFYARGKNPQWRNFDILSDYINRSCALITGGEHVAPAAVLYHAEAEWGGECEPFEKTVKMLTENQIDCDVIPADKLLCGGTRVIKNCLHAEKEAYRVLLIPYSENLPQELAEKLWNFRNSGLPVILLDRLPRRTYFGASFSYDFEVVAKKDLCAVLKSRDLCDIEVSHPDKDLAYYHYRQDGENRYFFINQSTGRKISVCARFPECEKPVLYSSLEDVYYAVQGVKSGDWTEVTFTLEPFETVFVLFSKEQYPCLCKKTEGDYRNSTVIDGNWEIRMAAFDAPEHFQTVPVHTLCDLSGPEFYPDFSGTVRYQIAFEAETDGDALLSLGDLYESAVVRINGQEVKRLIAPPYKAAILPGILRKGQNVLTVDVINTLVKAEHHNPFDRHFPQEPTGLLGEVRLYY